jgi:regulator of sirC expression with transglutaminase-like and TPR domain
MTTRRSFLAAPLLLPAPLMVAACRQRAVARPLTEALLAVAREEAGELPFDGAATEAELALLVRRARAALAAHGDLVTALREAVFTQSAFAREVDDTDLRFVLLPAVLADRRGSCVGLATLYLALAENLGLPATLGLDGILVPGHFFVRARQAGAPVRNVELLRQGEVVPDSFYRERYDLHRAAPAHLRALTTTEVAAVVRFNVGNERRRQSRLPEAVKAYAAAAAAFPQFGEAHASLGLALQLQGHLTEARAAYAKARAAEPGLPGLDHNIQRLETELASHEYDRADN